VDLLKAIYIFTSFDKCRIKHPSREFVFSRLDIMNACATHSSEWLSPKDGIADKAPRVYDKDTCVALGSKHVKKVVRHGRIEFEYLSWQSAAIPENFNKKTVDLYINESDLTNVWVINPDDPDDVYKLDPVDPDFQTAISLDFWRSYRAAHKERKEEAENPEEASRLRYEITKQLYDEFVSGK
jgi:hypothetical protein